MKSTTLPNKATIRVTREDIKRGKPECSTLCPIALAGKRKFGKRIRVDGWHVYVGETSHLEVYTLSARGEQFVYDFDRGKKVKPAGFVIKKYVDGI